MVHPSVLKAFDLDGEIAAVELYIDAIPPRRASGFMRAPYTPPALQPVTREITNKGVNIAVGTPIRG